MVEPNDSNWFSPVGLLRECRKEAFFDKCFYVVPIP